jgi:hypothetical protein
MAGKAMKTSSTSLENGNQNHHEIPPLVVLTAIMGVKPMNSKHWKWRKGSPNSLLMAADSGGTGVEDVWRFL